MRDPVGARTHARTLIGGVGYRWQGDGSFGLVVTDELARLDLPPHTEVCDLGYGAIFAFQDIGGADPPYKRLILLAAVTRGRSPGRLYVSRWGGSHESVDAIQERIREAGAGVIDLDHLLVIADYFRALPPDTMLIEFEPVSTAGGEEITEIAKRCAAEAIELVKAELNMTPV